MEKAPVVSEEKPSLLRAKQMYAASHGISPAEVTEKMLSDSSEGMEGWACKGMDCKARGPIGNAMYRAFKKNPTANEQYKWLHDDLKKKFRQSWAVERAFDFIQTKRIRTVTCKTKRDEIGSWKSELQLQQHFGGVDQPEAQRQATNYISKCREFAVTWLGAASFSMRVFRMSSSSTTSGPRRRTSCWWRSSCP